MNLVSVNKYIIPYIYFWEMQTTSDKNRLHLTRHENIDEKK